MLHHIKKLFGIKKKEEPAAEVPYKVEAPIADEITQVMLEPAPAKKPRKAPAAKKTRKPKAE